MVLTKDSTFSEDFSEDKFPLDYSDISTVQNSRNGGSLSVVAWTLDPRNQVHVTMTRHGDHREKVKMRSNVSESAAVNLIKTAAYRTIDDPDKKRELFEAAEAFEKPKPSEYPLEPSTYGQGNSSQN
jgi:hypothetical protein